MSKIEELFPELGEFAPEDFAKIGSTRPTLMIAMTARTGSSHLCSALSSVLPVGNPTEILNARDYVAWEKDRRNISTYAEFLAQYFEESSETIVFKTSWLDFEYFADKISYMFPNLKIVYLNRLDVEAQAISLYKARKTGRWHDAPHINNPEISPEQVNNLFSLREVLGHVYFVEYEKLHWEKYFFESDLQPVRVFYENLATDLPRTLRQIARYVGISEFDESAVKSEYGVLADEVTSKWLTVVKQHRYGWSLPVESAGSPVASPATTEVVAEVADLPSQDPSLTDTSSDQD